jgi:hypothetical protein
MGLQYLHEQHSKEFLMFLTKSTLQNGLAIACCLATFVPTLALAQTNVDTSSSAVPAARPPQEKENDGTDPTRPVRTASMLYEHIDLRGQFNSEIVTLNYSQPIGSGRSAVKVEVPFSSVDVLGNKSMDIGDVSFKFTNIPVVTRKYGIVIGLEMVLNTAARPELGSGKNVLKPSFIYAKFLKNGSIIAPSLVHNVSLWGDKGRPSVNLTTFDLYFVPRLKNPRMYMTIDPAMNIDWENKKEYPALAVTLGYKLGNMFGGKGQVFIKPSTTFFSDRPVDWGVKAGFQVLNF